MKGIYKVGFFTLMVGGTAMAIHATTWFNAWVGLELNMMTFLPFMIRGGEPLGAEAGLKYFLVQAVASLVMLASVMMGEFIEGTEELNQIFSGTKSGGSIMVWGVGLALALKLGMAPLHFWFPSIVENLTWGNLMILLTWQKIAPMKLLADVEWGVEGGGLLNGLILSSIFVGSVGGILQTSLAKVMAYSSMTHMGWMAGGVKLGGESWLLYLMTYSLMSLALIWVFQREGCFKLPHLWMKNSISPLVKLSLLIGVLSMGGLPPFLGFFPKWWIVTGLMEIGEKALGMVMVLTTLITLYYYFRVAFVVFMHLNSNPGLEGAHPVKENWNWVWGGGLMGLNFGGLMVGSLMMT
uniref:NADH-ubiquinone oxidoreductase chain 2 n=1 Tax=Eudohrnia metallica TaxID=2021301 RepID=A0A678PDN5_9NEOP|nr:NADH dehydrogenase subunit 2 [Eudohrnia metallica]